MADSTLSSNGAEGSDVFKEPITITDAYLTLISQLNEILKCCDVSTLRAALIHQARTPDGVKLSKAFLNELKAVESSGDLLSLIGSFSSCNWLDTRLIKALARGSGNKSAINLLDSYKICVYSKKLFDALPSFSKEHEKNKYVTAISTKIKLDNPDEVTIGDIVQHKRKLGCVILDLGNQNFDIKHVKKGCLQVCYVVASQHSFKAYKMALYNCQKFYLTDLILIEIGDNPFIFDLWLSDLSKHKQILLSLHEGKLKYYVCYCFHSGISFLQI